MERTAERMGAREIDRLCPAVGAALEAFLPSLQERERLALQEVYAGLTAQDLLSFSPEWIAGYVCAALRAVDVLGWEIPQEIVTQYLLPMRVNNEYPDGSREWLYLQLMPRVRGKRMMEAALEVNCWCAEQATYQSTDDRTIGPMGMCCRGRGRCGEESTLLVSALRAVGIPARQCYAPRWSHCDDNHAWVEFWADGTWHYMGACEPEPVPDRGWFTSAASRAMVVRALISDGRGGMRAEPVTERYGDTVAFRVRVCKKNEPLSGVTVLYQIVNDSRLCDIFETVTGEDGTAVWHPGVGTMLLSVSCSGRLTERLVDLRQERDVILDVSAGKSPTEDTWTAQWDMTPPKERIGVDPGGISPLFGRCEEKRQAKVRGFHQRSSRWLQLAGGNEDALRRFLAQPQPEKEWLLETLTEKDFSDVSAEALEDALRGALPYRGAYPDKIWREWILAPRVENEMLLPIRCLLAEKMSGCGFKRAAEVLEWMETHIRIVETRGAEDRRGNPAEYLRHGCCPAAEWQILAVQLCRSLGIPARLEPMLGLLETWEDGKEVTPAEPRRVALRLHTKGMPAAYREHVTLSRWDGVRYIPLALDGLVLDGEITLQLPPGGYRLTTNRRQIDGTASAGVISFPLYEEKTVAVALEEDKTAEKLVCRELSAVKVKNLHDAAIKELPLTSAEGSLLLWLECGREPTEHLLLELLELREAFWKGKWPVRILLQRPEMAEHPLLRQVVEGLPECSCYLSADDEDRYILRCAMEVGDGRLPLSVVLDGQGRGVYAGANYNIRTAHTLLRILQILRER